MPYSQENRIHTRANVYGGQAYNAFVAAIESIAYVLVRLVFVFRTNSAIDKRHIGELHWIEGDAILL